MGVIYLLIKTFESKDHAEAFMDGKLYMNKIGYFKEYCDAGEMRGDSYEGLAGIYQPERLSTIQFGDQRFSGSELKGSVLIHTDEIENKNVFCLYSVNSGPYTELSADNIEEFNKHIKMHEKFYELGNYCVIINHVSSFIERCRNAIAEKGFGLRMGHVEYFDPKTYHGMFPKDKCGFMKREQFRHQNEYRIIIDKHMDDGLPYILDIGSLRETTILSSIREFNDKIEMKLPND